MPEPHTLLKPQSWAELLALLSLDLLLPLFGDFGLRLTNPARFQSLLRHEIQRARKEAEANPELRLNFGQRFLPELQAQSSDDAAILTAWVERVCHRVHADSPQWSGWQLAFEEWLFNADARPELSERPALDALLARYKEFRPFAAQEKKFAEGRKKLLSEWDLEVFGRRGYIFDDDLTDPFMPISAWCERDRFQTFWKEKVLQLAPTVLEELRKHADEYLKSVKVWLPGPLQLPK